MRNWFHHLNALILEIPIYFMDFYFIALDRFIYAISIYLHQIPICNTINDLNV